MVCKKRRVRRTTYSTAILSKNRGKRAKYRFFSSRPRAVSYVRKRQAEGLRMRLTRHE